MIVEESVHVVFDETNPLQQDQRPKITDKEGILQEKQTVVELESTAGNQPVEKEIQSAKKVADNNLLKKWIEPRGL